MDDKLGFGEVIAFVLLALFFVFFFSCVEPEKPQQIWMPGHFEFVQPGDNQQTWVPGHFDLVQPKMHD